MDPMHAAGRMVAMLRYDVRMMRVLAWVAALCVSVAVEAADGLFDVAKRPAERALVTIETNLPVLAGPQSAMTRRLAGVLADLDQAGVRQLRGALGKPVAAADLKEGSERVCIVQLFAGANGKSVEILRVSTGALAARELSEGGADRAVDGATLAGLDEEKFFALASTWSAFRASLDTPAANAGRAIEPGAIVELARPYSPGWFSFDKDTLSGRFLHGRVTTLEGAKRPLGENAIWVRLPRGYDPKRPAGLLVWINAGYLGQPPEALHAAADELGLVCVGPAGAGNDTVLGNRCQLIFDAVATAAARFHVDPRRVYATGISGGGKISSMMWACFPDVFAGAVPIVGLACYENMPIGNGQYWPGNFDRPEQKAWALLKTRRAGAITGNKDFNFESIHAAAKIFRRDGLNVRVFEHDGMAHEMPRADGFLEAMSWVDEPYRTLRAAEESKAAAALEKVKKEFPSLSAETKRKRLVEVTALGPWTAPAWEAVEMIKAGP